MRVLVVEDTPDVARMYSALIRAYGHKTQIAHNGPQALRIATEFKPETVFLDIGLPGMDGYEVAERMRAMDELHDTRLIAVSGYEQDPQRSQKAGLDMYLKKPVSLDTMKQLLGLAVPNGTLPNGAVPNGYHNGQ